MSTEPVPAASRADAPAAANRMLAVDALRGLGALGVVTYHSASTSSHYPLPGMGLLHQDLDLSLMVFFVISGCLITPPFVNAMVDGRRRPSLRNFGIRRAARIFPAFWGALLVMLLITPASIAWWQPIAHALLLQDALPGQKDALIYPAWTLEVEACFYIGLALVGWWAFRRNRRIDVDRAALAVLGLWAFSFMVTVLADQFLTPLTPAAAITKYTFFGQIAYICPGLLIALAGTEAARRRGRWWAALDRLISRPRRLLAVIAAFVALGMVMTYPVAHLTIRDLHREPFAVAAGLMVAGALRYEKQLRPVARILLPVGLITYSLYLWHVVVITGLRNLHVYPVRAGILSWPLTWTFLVASSCAVGAASYLLLERPALRWSLKRGQIRALGSESAAALVPHVELDGKAAEAAGTR
jgi:peptidoglycan/LPS O-acetylase OafA/YrhL